MDVRTLVLDQLARYPLCEIGDLLKALYQSVLGCGHFAPDEAYARAYLERELAQIAQDAPKTPVSESLGAYSRAHLGAARNAGVSGDTLLKLFLLSAQAETPENRRAFEQAVDALEAMGREGLLPYNEQEFAAALARYREQGCPQLHHSDTFRRAYAPAYRVIRTSYAQLLPLFAQIDSLMVKKPRALIAIDGCCAGGKSTLAALLARVYDAQPLHMDDFFLQPHQRTKQRLDTPGENIDHERFLEEVLLPLSKGKVFDYRPYDCSRQAIAGGERMQPERLCIIEGSYSLHPKLRDLYDLRIFVHAKEEQQLARILARNGEEMLERFRQLWIPLENMYFEQLNVAACCHLSISTDGQDGYEVIEG